MVPGSPDQKRDKAQTAELLRAYLQAPDAATADAALGELLAGRADALIRNIVRSKLGRSRSAGTADIEDVCSETVVALIARLEEFRAAPQAEHLSDFEAFVAVIAYRACSGFFRRAHPDFHRLRNRLRYLLETQPGLAIWEDQRASWWCGLASWRERGPKPLPVNRALAEMVAEGPPVPAAPVEAVTHILRLAGAPVLFDDLAQVMSGIWSVPGGGNVAEPDQLASAAPSAQTSLEQRQWVERLWGEVRELPARQRSALLLNLHDAAGESVTTLLAVTRVASIGDLAEALAMSVEAFAAIWRELPWNDLRISVWLGVTRQQVINLRKSARERLSRRLLGGNTDLTPHGNPGRFSTTS